MCRKIVCLSATVALAIMLIQCAAAGGSTDPIEVVRTDSGGISFAGTVLPILQDHCSRCHGEDKKGGLQILTFEGVIAGGKSGDFVVAGDPDSSRLVTSVEKTREPFMPPRVFPALTLDRIQAIRQWIAEGAKNN